MSELTFGADPEFVFKHKGYFAPAQNYINGGIRAHIGTDGHADTGEIRPLPQKGALELAKEIEKRLKETYLNIAVPNKLTMHAGSMGGEGHPEPLGGHIHFGGIKNPNDVIEFTRYCDTVQLMLLFLEDFDENVIRRRRGFGTLGDQRPQPHGFEYRVPGSWLVNPTICKGTLCLYHSLAHDFVQKKLTAQHPLTKVKDWLINYELKNEFTNSNHEVFRYKLKPILKGIEELSLFKTNYNNYASYINSLFSLLKNGKQWNEDSNVFENWGFDKDLQEETLFHFGTGYKMEEITIRSTRLSCVKASERFPIQVFALGERKTYNISTNDDKLLEIINKFKIEYGDDTIIANKTIVLDTPKIQLGIGRHLRDNDTDLVQELLKFIKENRKKLV